jgi:hypothetical protein
MTLPRTMAVTHGGKLMEDVGWFWDHTDQGPVMAHDDVIAHDVCPLRARYPIEWWRLLRRFAHIQERHNGILWMA